MADALKSEFSLSEVELIPGGRGKFSVWLGEQVVAKKTYSGFPTEEEAITSMRAALATQG